MKVTDYFPLEPEALMLLYSNENRKIRSLVSTFFSLRIPLEPTHSKSVVKAILVNPVPGSSTDKILIGLLWNSLYGRDFKVYHWYILFLVFFKTMNKDKNSEAILTILMILSTQVGMVRYQSKMKPLRSLLIKALGEVEGQKAVDSIKANLPYKLPTKGPDIDSLLNVDLGSINQRKPKELNRIGVGYKDKGSLASGKPETLGTSESQVFVDYDAIFETLVRQIITRYSSILKTKH